MLLQGVGAKANQIANLEEPESLAECRRLLNISLYRPFLVQNLTFTVEGALLLFVDPREL